MRVMVVGGSGVTGRLVIEGLRAMPGVQCACAARHRDPRLPVAFHRLDIFGDRREAVDALRGADWAILCLGPFERVRARAHELCIEAGVHCLDVNDSVDARRDIVALDGPASEAGVRIVTGCGLCPGISTLLLSSLANRCARPADSVRADLFIGRGQDVGAGALASMLSSLTGAVRERVAGEIVEAPSVVERAARIGEIRPPYLVGYECPDVDIVDRILPGIDNYGYRVCFEQLSAVQIDILRRLPTLGGPAVVHAVAVVAARIASRLNRRRRSPATPAVLSIELRDDEGRSFRAGVRGGSSYQMTAACVLAVMELIGDIGTERIPVGVSEMDALDWARPDIWRILSRTSVDVLPGMIGI